jgi:hypothetical protein
LRSGASMRRERQGETLSRQRKGHIRNDRLLLLPERAFMDR